MLSIYDVIGSIDALNGRTVRVGGFLKTCSGYACPLYADENEARVVGEWFAAAERDHRVPASPLPEMLGIGDDDGFDGKAAPFVGGYVLITGKVDNRCRYKGKWGCTDRGPEIHPKSIEAWRPPAAAAGAPEKKS